MTPETPGERIKALRLQRKLTQEQLAKAAGLSVGFLSDVETGSSNIGAKKLLDLAEVLDVSLDYLMKGEEAAPPPKPAALEFPASLIRDAEKLGWSMSDARRLLSIQQQIIGFRNDHKSSDLESVDWIGLYKTVTKNH